MNPKKRFKKFYDRFLSLKGAPRTIALGMAIGVFIGVTPTIPFHTILIAVFTFSFRQNFTAALLGSFIVSNPLTIPFFYLIQYHLGRFILGADQLQIVFIDYSIVNIFNMGWCVVYPLFLGGLLMAPFFAVPAYFITVRTVKVIREKHQK